MQVGTHWAHTERSVMFAPGYHALADVRIVLQYTVLSLISTGTLLAQVLWTVPSESGISVPEAVRTC